MENRPPFSYQATVGIDWADRKHDVFVRFANGSSYRRKIGSRPEAIQEWLFELRSACAEGKIAIALEQRRGALFYQLCTHLSWIDLYPINPHSLSSFRLTFFSSRAKDDPKDGQLLEELLRTHCDRLRPYQPALTTERQLDLYCRQRRSLLGLVTKTELKLISTLKQYFPVAVDLFEAVGMKSDIALNFLSRWQTMHELRRAKTHTVRSFFYAHNSRSQSLIEKRLQQIGAALEVTDDPALIEPMVLMTKCLVGQLRQFNQTINEFDRKIKGVFKSHPDHFLFEALPGAGEKLAPRLLSLFGSDRSRWPDAADIQKYSGIAPVIERSGKSLWVHRRLSRPIFICQSFHEFAQQSTRFSSWANEFYKRQREKGKSHHSAIRSLAFKWIRIIFACWKANKAYDESFYLNALAKRNASSSPT
jgi:Transposase/Transposase IS116/IS110/IS902 family